MFETGKNKNGVISIYRFLFSIIICLLHFRSYGNFGNAPTAFYGGYLAVEFFFLVSGFFLMKEIEVTLARPEKNVSIACAVGKYAVKRYLRLYVPYILAEILTVCVRVLVVKNLTLKKFLLNGFFEIFMLQAFGFPYVTLILWYVSALLIGSVFLYWLSLLLKEHYLVIIAFASPIIISIFYQIYGHIDLTMTSGFLVSAGLWRAVAELGLGCLLYQAVKYLKARYRLRHRALATIFELALLAFILFIMFRTRRDVKDFYMLALIAALVLFAFWECSDWSRWFRHPVCTYLGAMSYNFYLNQAIFLPIFRSLFPGHNYWPTAVCFLAINFIFSMGTHALCKSMSLMIEKRFYAASR